MKQKIKEKRIERTLASIGLISVIVLLLGVSQKDVILGSIGIASLGFSLLGITLMDDLK